MIELLYLINLTPGMKHQKELRDYGKRRGMKRLRERYKEFIEKMDVRGRGIVIEKSREDMLKEIEQLKTRIAKNKRLQNTSPPYGPIGGYLRDKERCLYRTLKEKEESLKPSKKK